MAGLQCHKSMVISEERTTDSLRKEGLKSTADGACLDAHGPSRRLISGAEMLGVSTVSSPHYKTGQWYMTASFG